jgi:hypothetical protein
MTTFIFRCPHTGLNVQGHTKDDRDRGRAFEAIVCTACQRVHWVNPKTGKLLGEDD